MTTYSDKRRTVNGNRTQPLAPDGDTPPFEVGDLVKHPDQEDQYVVQFIEYDTEDNDWFVVISDPDEPLAANPLDAFDDYYNNEDTKYMYDWQPRNGTIRLVKVGTILDPVEVPPITTVEEAEKFLESLLEKVPGA